MRLTEKVMLMYVLIFLNGCATNERAFCTGWLPIYLERYDLDMIGPNLARDLLKHNKQGEHMCDWQHGKKIK
ncbi:hypothetical protein [Bartonella ancashensis]|uniref:Uncharacterized protein n=1 Tax=Bartonella ancashensis TaxID=1318743 RepID=A0A0M4LJT6_9HYPH|nr:hypothetical protein [Bartonella ancashensis]ALE04156.1 hypothetical protein PU02_1342 [Bartonella ancashensis]